MALARLQPLKLRIDISVELPLIIDEMRPEDSGVAIGKMARIKIADALSSLVQEINKSGQVKGMTMEVDT